MIKQLIALSFIPLLSNCGVPPAFASDDGRITISEQHTEEITHGSSLPGPNCQISIGSMGHGSTLSLAGPLCGPKESGVGQDILIKRESPTTTESLVQPSNNLEIQPLEPGEIVTVKTSTVDYTLGDKLLDLMAFIILFSIGALLGANKGKIKNMFKKEVN